MSALLIHDLRLPIRNDDLDDDMDDMDDDDDMEDDMSDDDEMSN